MKLLSEVSCLPNCHQLVSIVEQGNRVASIQLKFSLEGSILQDKSFSVLLFIDLTLSSHPFSFECFFRTQNISSSLWQTSAYHMNF